MRLILIRHAKAGNRDDPKYPDDRTRPLTREGRREHKRIAGALAKMSVDLDHIWTSPILRAKETAEITAREMGFTGALFESPLLGEAFSIDGLIAALKPLPSECSVACVGHEPHLGRLAAALLHPDGSIAIKFKKSAAMGLDFPARAARGKGTLLFFLRPDHLLSLLG
ncbi:MAG: histidine phosphatase family protein [Acidobacteria bacterium]|nr:histidine phosphatase family protein [Acidobacteriota bacterium]